MKYVIYSRVSTEEQEVESQEEDCLQYIKQISNSKEYKYEIFSDPETSSRVKMENRENLMNMLNSLRRGDQVVVWKLDRLSRDVIEMVTIHRLIKSKQCTIHSLNDSNADDEFMVGLMGVLAQKERADISVRTKSHLKRKLAKNERRSRFIPFGQQLDEVNLIEIKKKDKKAELKPGLLLENTDEQLVLLKMLSLFDQGLSYRQIANSINAEGYTNRVGNPFQHNSIYRILLRHGRSRSWDQLPSDSEHLLSHQSK